MTVAGERSTPIADRSFASVPPSDALHPPLRADLLATWVAVTEAGGAVGFTAPVDLAAVAREPIALCKGRAAATFSAFFARATPLSVELPA